MIILLLGLKLSFLKVMLLSNIVQILLMLFVFCKHF